jgi:hypothetical protein
VSIEWCRLVQITFKSKEITHANEAVNTRVIINEGL